MRYYFAILSLLAAAQAALSQTDTLIYEKETGDGQIIRDTFFTDELSRRRMETQARIGQLALPFQALDANGNPHTSDQYLGQVLVLYFWNVWDWDSCERQTLELNRLHEKYGGKGVQILSFVREQIGLDETAFLTDHPVRFPIVPGSWDFGMTYHGYQEGTPIVFVIGKTGIWQQIGKDEKQFEAWIEAARRG